VHVSFISWEVICIEGLTRLFISLYLLNRGRDCADPRHPGVYARTSYFYDWIVETSCTLSRDPPDYFQCPRPSDAPSIVPSLSPSSIPSDAPSIAPSSLPSVAPSDQPSLFVTPSQNHVTDFINPWNLSAKDAPPIVPSSSPSVAPSDQPSLSTAPSQNRVIDFIAWNPPAEDRPLGHCRGDCDYDTDCAGDMLCFQRSWGSSSAPGCAEDASAPDFADFCIFASDKP
jgi:hypothetical protein